MEKKNLVLIGVFGLILSACAGKDNQAPSGSSSVVNGKPAGEYYQQFVRVSGGELCQQSSLEDVDLVQLQASLRGVSQFTLVLSPDSTYQLQALTPQGSASTSGQWKVEGTGLVFVGTAPEFQFGEAVGIEYNGAQVLQFTFSKNSELAEAIRGQTLLFRKVATPFRCEDRR